MINITSIIFQIPSKIVHYKSTFAAQELNKFVDKWERVKNTNEQRMVKTPKESRNKKLKVDRLLEINTNASLHNQSTLQKMTKKESILHFVFQTLNLSP